MNYCLENYSTLFLDILFELNNNGGNFSDSEIRDEVITMMIAVNICCFQNILYNILIIIMLWMKYLNVITGQRNQCYHNLFLSFDVSHASRRPSINNKIYDNA